MGVLAELQNVNSFIRNKIFEPSNMGVLEKKLPPGPRGWRGSELSRQQPRRVQWRGVPEMSERHRRLVARDDPADQRILNCQLV